MMNDEKYEVVIIGGGLAGLTLALQLKQNRPSISMLVLEKRKENAPVATHKVGESLSEMGAFYLREILKLKDYLSKHQLRKFGFRFFFSPEQADNIERRVEVGSKIFNPFPTHQIDRGLLENELVQKLKDAGVEILLGAKVTEVELSKQGHSICFEHENRTFNTEATWMVDSTGRNSLLKRKLGLEKEIGHTINSSWFRLDAEIDIDYWSDNLNWRSFVAPGLRRLSTNHLMGHGYWVWIIPLIDGKTSIGIVADPVFHPFNEFNTFDKAMKWLEEHEPQAAKMLEIHRDKQMDFKVMKNFAYDTKQFYSADKWAVSGEAGAFMDPLYSPGSDFIGLGNTWITDLIVRDLNKEDTALRSLIYDFAHKELLNGWITLYRNMYGIFGKTQVMLMKIVWDWASYWAIPNVLFINNGYTDLTILKQYSASGNSIGRRFSTLNDRMQELFRAWGQYDNEPYFDHQLNVFDLACLNQFQSELTQRYSTTELMTKIESNLKILEHIAAEIFRVASNKMLGTPATMNVDPYNMEITDEKEELINKSKEQAALPVDHSIKTDISKMWLKKTHTVENEFA